jgi:hypothetical protein
MNKTDSNFCLRWAKQIMAINLLGGKCRRCGSSNIMALEFHHIDKNKEHDICSLNNNRWSIMKNEVKKCELLCRNCHFKTHSSSTKRNVKLKLKLLNIKGIYKCEKCGCSSEDPGVLTFHHLKDKKFNINTIRIRYADISWEDIILEIDKCKILCHNCHIEEHTNIDKFYKLEREIKFKINNYKEKRSPVDKNSVCDMYFIKNMKQIDIAKYFGCARSTICGIIKHLEANGYKTNEKITV